jgi:hypothetical protein
MSGRVYLFGLGITLVGLGFTVTDAVLGPRPGVTDANVRRIKMGMLRGEVEAILGGPGEPAGVDGAPGWYRHYFAWTGPDGWVRVGFGSPSCGLGLIVEDRPFMGSRDGWKRRAGGVEDVVFMPIPRPKRFDRLRAWVGW